MMWYTEIVLDNCAKCDKKSVPVKDGLCLTCRKEG
jgi:hypothetical protein